MTRQRMYTYQYCFTAGLFCAAGMFLPGIVQNTAGTGAFSAFLFAFAPGAALTAMTAFVFKNGRGPLEAYAFSFGRPAARAVLAVSAAYYIFIAAELMAFYALYAARAAQMSMPVLFLLPVMAGVCFAAAKRTAAIGRMAAVIGGLMLALSVFFLMFSVFGGRAENLFPIVSVTPDTLIRTTLSLTAVEFGQLSAVMCLSGALEDRKKLVKSTLLSALAGNGVILLIAFMTVYLNGQTTALNRAGYVPGYAAGTDMGGLKVLAAAALFFAAVFRAAVCLRAAAVCAGQAFNTKKYRALIYPLGAAALVVSALLMTGIGKLAENVMRYSYIIALPVGAAAPLAAFVIAAVKKRKRRRNN